MPPASWNSVGARSLRPTTGTAIAPTCVTLTRTGANTTLGRLWQQALPHWSAACPRPYPFLGTPQHELSPGGEGLEPAPRHRPHEPVRLHFRSTGVAGHRLRCLVARSSGHSVRRARPREGAVQTTLPGVHGGRTGTTGQGRRGMPQGCGPCWEEVSGNWGLVSHFLISA